MDEARLLPRLGAGETTAPVGHVNDPPRELPAKEHSPARSDDYQNNGAGPPPAYLAQEALPHAALVAPSRSPSRSGKETSAPNTPPPSGLLAWFWSPPKVEALFSESIERAAERLELGPYATFDTGHKDNPPHMPLMNLTQAKAHLSALEASCASAAEWDSLVASAHAIMATRVPAPIELFNVKSLVFAPKPDGLDTLVLVHALSRVPAEVRAHIAKAGKPLFEQLHASDHPTLIAALRARVEPSDWEAFCGDLSKFSLRANEPSERAGAELLNVFDCVVQADATLQLKRHAPNTLKPYDNLGALSGLSALGAHKRNVAMEAAALLGPLYREGKFPLELIHTFEATSSQWLGWVDAANNLCETLHDTPPYLAFNVLDAQSHAALITTLFYHAAKGNAPPPYEVTPNVS